MLLTAWHDVLGGAALAAVVAAAGRSARRSLAVGTAVGLLWEVPLTVLQRGPAPLFADLVPWPLPRAAQPLVHALWDGALLSVGAGLAALLPGHAPLVRTAWGSAQQVAAEVVGGGRVWRWTARPWSPVVAVGPVRLPLLPQLVWAVAPAVHARVLRRLS